MNIFVNMQETENAAQGSKAAARLTPFSDCKRWWTNDPDRLSLAGPIPRFLAEKQAFFAQMPKTGLEPARSCDH